VIRIEFYGIPRKRAGIDSIDVEAATLQEALSCAVAHSPALLACCTADGRLKLGYVANVNGRTFVHDPHTPLDDGDSLLLMSADAGG
jgi:molybdopterin converting factor small subunit